MKELMSRMNDEYCGYYHLLRYGLFRPCDIVNRDTHDVTLWHTLCDT